ncbi:MAG: FkbM family methyltransferase [Petrotogales bacterium]
MYNEGVKVRVSKNICFDVFFTNIKDFKAARRFTHFEPEFIKEFLYNIKSCNVFYDVGSYIGLYSLSALSHRKDVTVISIDPDPKNCESLEKNIIFNKFDNNSVIICAALSDKDGNIEFSFSGKSGGSSGHVKRSSESETVRRVCSYKLDTLIQKKRLPAPELIKIDVEGYEANVLRGMENTIEICRPIIMVEVHPQFLENYGESYAGIDKFMKSYRYIKKTLHIPGKKSRSKHRQFHVSYVPKERLFAKTSSGIAKIGSKNKYGENNEKARMPLVSVIIPTHNRANLVSRAIQSVLYQTFQNLEIIVVDDASSDNTPDVIETLRREDNRVRYIRNEISLGGSGARNVGIQNARGDYISFLDDDDEWLPRKLERQIPLADNYSVVGCRSEMSENLQLFSMNLIRRKKAENSYCKLKVKEITLNDIFYNNGRLSPTVALTRRDYLLEINGFDESLSGAQGRDLFVRLVMSFGHGLMVEEKLAIHHKKHGLNRITDSPNHLKGCWQEFKKHSKYMPWHLYRWRKYHLCLREAKNSREIEKIMWFIKAFLNINPYWPLRSIKLLLLKFFVK